MKNKKNKHLYFIAIVAPGSLQDELTALKHTAKKRFHAGHALNSPAHLTLIPPFFATEEEMKDLIKEMSAVLKRFKPFPLELNGFGRFGNRVIYVAVNENDNLVRLQEELFRIFKQKFPRYTKPNRFHPHFTVAFRDLDKNIFPQAWKYFSAIDFNGKFDVDNINVLRHQDKKWHIVDHIELTDRKKSLNSNSE